MRTGKGRSSRAQSVGVTGTVAALVMPAHRLVNFRPGKLYAAHNLMPDHGVVRHLAELLGVQGLGLAEQAAVDRHLAYVVQISGAAQRSHFAGVDAHSLADCGSIAAYAQRVAMNVDMLHINRGRERLDAPCRRNRAATPSAASFRSRAAPASA